MSEADILAGYVAWHANHGAVTPEEACAIQAHIGRMQRRPDISVLVLLQSGAAAQARATLASLDAQLYPAWHCVLAGDAAAWDEVGAGAELLPGQQAQRLRTARLGPGTGLAGCGTAALAQADGDFVLLLMPGETLARHALYEIAALLAARPEADVVYSDEDEITATGEHGAPKFKPGWDSDLLLTHDYLGGLVAYRRRLLERIGGLDGRDAGALRYGLALRATAAAGPDCVAHIPAVLFHRPADGAHSPDGAAAVAQAFVGRAAQVMPSPLAPGYHRVQWLLPSPAPHVTVIVPIRDRAGLLLTCAEGVLRRTDYPSLDLLIVDNDSVEPQTGAALAQLQADTRVSVLPYPGAFNYAAINNAAVQAATGAVVVLLNSDTAVIHPGWLHELAAQAMRPDVGAVGAKLLYADETVQHGGVVLAPGGHLVHQHRLAPRCSGGYLNSLRLQRETLVATAACLAMRRSVFLQTGGLDADLFAISFNDVDFCLRLREQGYRVIWTPYAELFHYESQSRGRAASHAERTRETREANLLRRRWNHLFPRDPFLNQNLTCSWDEPLRLSLPRRVAPWQAGKQRHAGAAVQGDR